MDGEMWYCVSEVEVMVIKELIEQLEKYDPNKEIHLVDWINGVEYDFSIDIDDNADDVCIILGEVI